MLQAPVVRYRYGSSSLALDSGQASTHSSNPPSSRRKWPHRHFGSILFERAEDMSTAHELPAFIGDSNLNQIVDAVTAGLEEYRLQELFKAEPLQTSYGSDLYDAVFGGHSLAASDTLRFETARKKGTYP